MKVAILKTTPGRQQPRKKLILIARTESHQLIRFHEKVVCSYWMTYLHEVFILHVAEQNQQTCIWSTVGAEE